MIGSLGISSADDLMCDFHNTHFGYACQVSILNNQDNNLTITGLAGSEDDLSVTFLSIYGTNATYIPAGLGRTLNITTLQVSRSILKKISKDNFLGMKNLLHLNLNNNQLIFIPSDSFQELKKLEILSLSHNQLTELGNEIFLDNLSLKRIYLQNNRLKFMGFLLFHHLRHLSYVKLSGNVCVNRIYENPSEIETLKDGLLNCNGLELPESVKLIQCLEETKRVQILTLKNQDLMNEIKFLRNLENNTL